MVVLNLLGAPGSHLGGACGSWEPTGSHPGALGRPLGGPWEPPQGPLQPLGGSWEPLRNHQGASESSGRRPGAPRRPRTAQTGAPDASAHSPEGFLRSPAPGATKGAPGGLPNAPEPLTRLYVDRALGPSFLGPQGALGRGGAGGWPPAGVRGGAPKRFFRTRQSLQMPPPIVFRDFRRWTFYRFWGWTPRMLRAPILVYM